MIKYHIIAFVTGYFLDLLIGDPHSLPHPVALIGKLIHFLDEKLYRRAQNAGTNTFSRARAKRWYGTLMTVIVVAVTAFVTSALLFAAYHVHPYLGCALEAVMTGQILAARSLCDESMKVYDRLKNGTLQEAREAVSMIVGRDTQALSKEQVTKAAVETVAENTSDGIIAPMLFTALGGPVLGFSYKAVNTMDSMVGYRNDRYLDFGRASAKLDDFVNYLPSRISALFMIFSCLFMGKSYSAGRAAHIWKRDRRKHASPNSAQTESVMAGALGVQLAGDASYFGKIVKKPFIGDPIRKIEPEDIRRANRLMFVTEFFFVVLCTGLLFLMEVR